MVQNDSGTVPALTLERKKERATVSVLTGWIKWLLLPLLHIHIGLLQNKREHLQDDHLASTKCLTLHAVLLHRPVDAHKDVEGRVEHR